MYLGVVRFEAMGANDIHICFHRDLNATRGQDGVVEGNALYEVLFGGWLNSKVSWPPAQVCCCSHRELCRLPSGRRAMWLVTSPRSRHQGNSRILLTEPP